MPIGKLHEDRYLPLHPRVVELVDAYRNRHVPEGHHLLLPRENGKPLDRHGVTRFINKAGAAAGLAHIHPHQLRHTLATQAINRGMSIEAIAAMLGMRRETVIEAAGTLQAAGLIRYARGRIDLVDRRGLEGRACECHAFVAQEYQRLLG